MRRKRIVFIDVDIYLVGLHLGQKSLQLTKKWISNNGEAELHDVLLENFENKRNEANILISLHFMRDVSKQQLLQAFNDAFHGSDIKLVSDFTSALSITAGPEGMKTREELFFCWLDTGELAMRKDKGPIITISNKSLAKKLLQVYLDPNKSVCPDLLNCVTKFASFIH